MKQENKEKVYRGSEEGIWVLLPIVILFLMLVVYILAYIFKLWVDSQ